MKRTFVFSLMFLLFLVGAKAATTDINLERDQPPVIGPVPLSMTYYPVSATVNETELAIYFDWSVGNATITVYDDTNNVIHQEIINTNTYAEVYIDNTSWSSGDYTVKISYGTTRLIGYFQIP
jgi:hypothetical protein